MNLIETTWERAGRLRRKKREAIEEAEAVAGRKESGDKMSFAYYVNEKLWLCTEQPDGWRSELEELEEAYNAN